MDEQELKARDHMIELLRDNYGIDEYQCLLTPVLCKLCWTLFDDLPDWFAEVLSEYNK